MQERLLNLNELPSSSTLAIVAGRLRDELVGSTARGQVTARWPCTGRRSRTWSGTCGCSRGPPAAVRPSPSRCRDGRGRRASASRSLLPSSENSARRGRAGPAAEEAPWRTPFRQEHGNRSWSPGREGPWAQIHFPRFQEWSPAWLQTRVRLHATASQPSFTQRKVHAVSSRLGKIEIMLYRWSFYSYIFSVLSV